MSVTTYTCWHGEPDDRYDEAEIEARYPDDAARRFALRSDEGEDYDIVFVLVDGEVYEYRCRYERDVTCDSRLVKSHGVPS